MNNYYCRFLSESPADHLKAQASLREFLGAGLQWQDHQNGMSVHFASPWTWAQMTSRIRAASTANPNFMFRLYQESSESAMEWQIMNGQSASFTEVFPLRQPVAFTNIHKLCHGESLQSEMHGTLGPEQP